MTKLEKEAEQQAFEKYPIPQNWDSINLARNSCYEEGYIDGAKPREKRIADLEAQIEKMKCCQNCKFRNKEYDDADFTKAECIGCCPGNNNWEFGE